DRSAAAHRSLVHAGVDLARLRTAAMQVALGVVAARKLPPAPAPVRGTRGEADSAPAPARSAAPRARPSSPPPSSGPGVAVPIMPAAPARRPALVRAPEPPA